MSRNISIVGAGMCGMCTALALAGKGDRITIYERDDPPPEGGPQEAFFQWNRKGAAQFRHPHAFLGLMCNILQDNYPDLIEDFWAAGARRVNFEEMLTPELMAQYQPEAGDEKLWLLMCRRATMETVLRRYVERQADIEICSSATVVGIVAGRENDSINVQGLRLVQGGERREIISDLVVDASGRTSRFPGWFAEMGTEIEVEQDASEIVYYTRHFRLLPGVEEPKRGTKDRSAGDLGYIKYGVFPGEEGHFAIIICLPIAETELREAVKDGDQFDLICNSIPGLVPWVREGVCEATTHPFGFGDIHTAWRHLVKDCTPVALNYFAVGDAAVRTNPLYGRGCSIGILHAHLLADVIHNFEDPVERAIAFDRRTEEEIRPIFETSLREDQNGIKRAAAIRAGKTIDPGDSFRRRLRLAFGDAVAAAARDDIHVVRGAMRTFNLLEKPGDFLKDWRTRFTILRYLLRGRTANALARMQRGPSRAEMAELIQP